jgi:NAD(P)-dependent dehydrogenase (short-subunit alcohol dehydrogenase family)
MLSKTAIITGATGNLGQAVLKKFIENDYGVWGTVHSSPGKFSLKNDHRMEGKVHAVTLDLLDDEACELFVDKIVSIYKNINVAVLTAGGFTMGDITTTKSADVMKQYQLNFETAYNMARPVFKQMMKQNSGRIFLIGSQAGLNTSKAKGVTAYSLSKSLVFRLAEIMNLEAKNKNVVISVIVPGTIDTPQNRQSMPNADFNNWVSPSQIADVIYFYSGEEASVIRDPVIKVYGNS